MKRIVISGAVLALAIGGMGVASAEKPSDKGNNGGFKVTGGGQIITNTTGGGAGDTVGFNAHRLYGGAEDAAKGQFQYVPRDNDSADASEDKFHGVVTCLISANEAQSNEADEEDGNVEEALTRGARFGGYIRNSTQAFTVDVTDNGQGASNTEGDMILVRLTETPCADNPEDESGEAEELIKLGRGNVKIHNNPDDAAPALLR